MGTTFLIGATGNIGKHLMAELAPDHKAGRLDVRVGARSENSAKLVRDAGLVPAKFDFEDFAAFDKALAGVSTVFMVRPYTLKHIMYGKQVIDAARRAGVRSVVLIGSFAKPDTPWPVVGWNFLVESWAERSGMAWTHIRPNYFMDNVLGQRDRASGMIFNRLTARVSWISSEDIAAASAAVLRDPMAHAGKAYPLAAVAMTMEEIADRFTAITGQKHSVVISNPEKVMERLLAQGREPFYADALFEYVDAVNAGKVPEIADTFDTVERLCGRPALSFDDFIKKHKAEL